MMMLGARNEDVTCRNVADPNDVADADRKVEMNEVPGRPVRRCPDGNVPSTRRIVVDANGLALSDGQRESNVKISNSNVDTFRRWLLGEHSDYEHCKDCQSDGRRCPHRRGLGRA